MEEINFNQIKSQNNFIPIDKERISKANKDLKLKRMNPINSRNTLGNCLNLKQLI